MFLGLRTVIYPTDDLDAAKEWFTGVVGHGPYFDQPFYVGYEVGGYELGVMPRGQDGQPDGPITYWGVEDADASYQALLDAGARPNRAPSEVGEGIKTGDVIEPSGNVLGIIENPHFTGGQ